MYVQSLCPCCDIELCSPSSSGLGLCAIPTTGAIADHWFCVARALSPEGVFLETRAGVAQEGADVQPSSGYQEFRRQIAGPEFKTVVFHRMVDIGRCAKCEYYKWKCATVPVDLRVIWQDALSQHHLLQIQQKRCYAADRVRAATDFPRSELYLAS